MLLGNFLTSPAALGFGQERQATGSRVYRGTEAIAVGLCESASAKPWPIHLFVLQGKSGRDFPLYLLLMGKTGLKLTKKKLTGLSLIIPTTPAEVGRQVKTSPVGSFPPNTFGLHDMHGNVLQWVQDCFAGSYSGLPTDGSAYEEAVQLKTAGPFPSSDVTGTNSCSYRMVRGGDWGDPPSMIRSAFRNFGPGPGATLQDYRSGGVGFRVARTLD